MLTQYGRRGSRAGAHWQVLWQPPGSPRHPRPRHARGPCLWKPLKTSLHPPQPPEGALWKVAPRSAPVSSLRARCALSSSSVRRVSLHPFPLPPSLTAGVPRSIHASGHGSRPGECARPSDVPEELTQAAAAIASQLAVGAPPPAALTARRSPAGEPPTRGSLQTRAPFGSPASGAGPRLSARGHPTRRVRPWGSSRPRRTRSATPPTC